MRYRGRTASGGCRGGGFGWGGGRPGVFVEALSDRQNFSELVYE